MSIVEKVKNKVAKTADKIKSVVNSVRKVEKVVAQKVIEHSRETIQASKQQAQNEIKVSLQRVGKQVDDISDALRTATTKEAKDKAKEALVQANNLLEAYKRIANSKHERNTETINTTISTVSQTPNFVTPESIKTSESKHAQDAKVLKDFVRDAEEADKIQDETTKKEVSKEVESRFDTFVDSVEDGLKDSIEGVRNWWDESKEIISEGKPIGPILRPIGKGIDKFLELVVISPDDKSIVNQIEEFTGLNDISKAFFNYDLTTEQNISPSDVKPSTFAFALVSVIPGGGLGKAGAKVVEQTVAKKGLRYVPEFIAQSRKASGYTGWISKSQAFWDENILASIKLGVSGADADILRQVARTEPEIIVNFAKKHPDEWAKIARPLRNELDKVVGTTQKGSALLKGKEFVQRNPYKVGAGVALIGGAISFAGFAAATALFAPIWESFGLTGAFKQAGITDTTIVDTLKKDKTDAKALVDVLSEATFKPTRETFNLLSKQHLVLNAKWKSDISELKKLPTDAKTLDKINEAYEALVGSSPDFTSSSFIQYWEAELQGWNNTAKNYLSIIRSRLLTEEKEQPAPTGILTVTGTPVGAKVQVSEIEFPGVLPYKQSVPLGQYIVTVTQFGYVAESKEVSILTSKGAKLSFDLKSVPENVYTPYVEPQTVEELAVLETSLPVTINALPEVGAKVTINGIYQYATTPLTVFLPPSEYLVRLEADGYSPAEVVMPIEAFQDGSLTVELTPEEEPTVRVSGYDTYQQPSYEQLQESFQPQPLVQFREATQEDFYPPQIQLSQVPMKESFIGNEIVVNIETTGLQPFESRVVCIGLKNTSDPNNPIINFLEDTEEATLRLFLQYIQDNSITEIVGYNFAFDLRFLFTKCLFYRIPAKELTDATIHDVQQIMEQVHEKFIYGNNKSGKLDDWSAHLLGISPPATQEEVLEAIADARWDFVKDYNFYKVDSTFKLWSLAQFTKENLYSPEQFTVTTDQSSTPFFAGSPEGGETVVTSSPSEPLVQNCSYCFQENLIEEDQNSFTCTNCGRTNFVA